MIWGLHSDIGAPRALQRSAPPQQSLGETQGDSPAPAASASSVSASHTRSRSTSRGASEISTVWLKKVEAKNWPSIS